MHDRHDHEDARPFTANYASIEVDPDIYIPARSRRGILDRLLQLAGLRRLAH